MSGPTERQPAKPEGSVTPGQEAPERIVAAAIRENGTVFTGPHHHQIIRYVVPLVGLKTAGQEQGFITDRNRFVDRAEAGRLAYASGQTEQDGGSLFSEMLWNVPDTVFLGAPPVQEEAARALGLALIDKLYRGGFIEATPEPDDVDSIMPMLSEALREAHRQGEEAGRARCDAIAKSLAEAAQEINCAGPVAHRIRIQRQEYVALLEAAEERARTLRQDQQHYMARSIELEAELTKAEDALAVEQERARTAAADAKRAAIEACLMSVCPGCNSGHVFVCGDGVSRVWGLCGGLKLLAGLPEADLVAAIGALAEPPPKEPAK